MISAEESKNIKQYVEKYRKQLFEKFVQVGQGHPGSTFSMLEMATTLYHGGYNRFDSEYFLQLIYKLTNKYDDINFDIISRTKINENLDRFIIGKDPNPTFDFYRFFSYKNMC